MELILDLSPLGNALVKEYNDYEVSDEILTSSKAGQSIRKIVLYNRHKYEFKEKASDLFKSTLGKVQHRQILYALDEKYPGLLIVEKTFKDTDIKGTPDLYAIEDVPELGINKGWLIDLKCVNVGTWLLNTDDFHHYRYQLHMNRYFLEKNGYPVTRQFLWFVFTDWTQYKNYKGDDNFPRPEEMYEVPLLGYVPDDKIAEIKSYDDVPDDALPECSRLDTWEKSPWKVYGYTKAGKVRANAMNGGSFFTEAEAEAFAQKQDQPTEIKYVAALDKPGCRACGCRHWCNLYEGSVQAPETEADDAVYD